MSPVISDRCEVAVAAFPSLERAIPPGDEKNESVKSNITRIRVEPAPDSGLDNNLDALHAFDDHGHYTGLPDFPETKNITVKHFTNHSLQALWIKSALLESDKDHATFIDWMLSLEGIAETKYLHNRNTTPAPEGTWHIGWIWTVFGIVFNGADIKSRSPRSLCCGGNERT